MSRQLGEHAPALRIRSVPRQPEQRSLGALETPVTGFLFPLWRLGARQRLAAASA